MANTFSTDRRACRTKTHLQLGVVVADELKTINRHGFYWVNRTALVDGTGDQVVIEINLLYGIRNAGHALLINQTKVN